KRNPDQPYQGRGRTRPRNPKPKTTQRGRRGSSQSPEPIACCSSSTYPVACPYTFESEVSYMSSVGFDSTIPFLREGYSFVSSRCDALNTDLFTGRIGLRPATFIRGAEADELFYDKNHITRQGAMPPTVVHLLQDQGSVQALDGDAHRQRKRAFLDLMSDAAMQRLGDIFDEYWDQAVRGLPTHKHVVLHQMAREVLTRTACQWSGIDLDDADIPRLSKELG